MEWANPPEKDQDKNNPDASCLQSFCLYMKLQLGQFSHFSVRTVSPDFENEHYEDPDRTSVHSVSSLEADEEMKTPPMSPEALEKESSKVDKKKSSSPEKKRRKKKKKKKNNKGASFGLGFDNKDTSSSSSSSSSSADEAEFQEILADKNESPNDEIDKPLENGESVLENGDADRDDVSSKPDSPNMFQGYLEDLINTTKEAYGVQKAGAETVIDKTLEETKPIFDNVADTTVEMKDKAMTVSKYKSEGASIANGAL
jgi:hypothetical protein